MPRLQHGAPWCETALDARTAAAVGAHVVSTADR